jgi:hypothetical protein
MLAVQRGKSQLLTATNVNHTVSEIFALLERYAVLIGG